MMRRCGALLLLVAAACTESGPPAQRAPAAETARAPQMAPAVMPCPAQRVWGDSAETVALRCADGVAYRARDTLVIKLGNGRTMTLLQRQGREASSYYTYEGLLRGRTGARTFHVINSSNGEWSEELLFDAASGDSVRLAVQPTVSPDGARLLVNAVDANLCEDPAAFSLWRVTTGLPEREWIADASCGRVPAWSANATWRTDDSIAVIRVVPQRYTVADTGTDEWTHEVASLVRRAGQWEFHDYPAAGYCHGATEQEALRCGRHPPTRRGDTLVFVTPRGRVVRVDQPADDERHVEFRYHGLLRGLRDAELHIVDVQGYESAGVELIAESTGDSLTLAGHPLPSPDGAHFAVQADGHDTCEGTVQLDVWSLDSLMPTQEFTVNPYDCTWKRGWWPSNVAWRSVDTLTFARRRRDDSDAVPGLLVRRATGWALDSASAAAVPRPPAGNP